MTLTKFAAMILAATLLSSCKLMDDLGRYRGERQSHPLKPSPIKPYKCETASCRDFLRGK